MSKKLFCAVIFVLVMLVCCMGYAEGANNPAGANALAAEVQADMLWRYDDQIIEKDVEMAQLKTTLYEKGFYSSAVGNDISFLDSSELDIQTKCLMMSGGVSVWIRIR